MNNFMEPIGIIAVALLFLALSFSAYVIGASITVYIGLNALRFLGINI